MFAALGRFGYRRRRWVLAGSLLFVVIAGVWGTGVFSVVSDGGFEDPNAESTRATEVLEEELGHDGADIIVVFEDTGATVDAPEFADAATETLNGLPISHVESVVSYWTPGLPDSVRADFVSEDEHAAYAAITLVGDSKEERSAAFGAIAEDLEADGLATHVGGPIAIEHDMSQRAESDIVRAELLSLPVLLLLLVIIFGGVVAASLPLAIGGLAILGSLTLLRVLAHLTELSVFSVNVATILGLGLAIDYGLFIVSRFREEMARRGDAAAALPATLATAGRTIAFSGVTVLISFCGLLFFPQPMMRSIGMGGIAVVLFDMLAALVVLPALLAVLGNRVDALRIPWPRRTVTGAVARRAGVWANLARGVMRRPLLWLVIVGAVLLAFGTPLLQMAPGYTDQRSLPADSGGRVATEMLQEEFPGDQGQLDVAVTGPVAEANLDDYVERLDSLEGASGAEIHRQDEDIAHVTVGYEGEIDDPETSQLVRDVRAEEAPAGTEEVLVGGIGAAHVDSLEVIADVAVWTVLFVVAVTLVLLFLAFGSVVLPLKAVLMGFVSLGASLGVIVWGFQEGNLAAVLDFDAVGTTDPMNLVIILVIAFGLAMDYELFLLSRVREEYLATGDNPRSVATGLQRTGHIITSAALLLVVVLAAMGTSSLMLLKLMGIGLAVAVVVDATLVRAVLVPALMRLLGPANWWLPKPLRWLHDRIGISEGEEPPPDTTTRESEERSPVPVG